MIDYREVDLSPKAREIIEQKKNEVINILKDLPVTQIAYLLKILVEGFEDVTGAQLVVEWATFEVQNG